MYRIDFNAPIPVHFIGIGGISMSGLAELLHTNGFRVSGSDTHQSHVTKHLESLGIPVTYQQCAANIAGFSGLVVYTAAVKENNPELQEAAIVDGASRIQRIWHVDIPCIRPTVITMLIFNCASIVNIGFDKVYLMQNSLNSSVSEVISTFVYKVGMTNSNFGFSTAAGLFQSVVSFVLLVAVNQICKKITETSLW